MKTKTARLTRVCCLICASIIGPAAVSRPAFASETGDPAWKEADKMFEDAARLEAAVIGQCVQAGPKLLAETQERLKTMDQEIEKTLGKRPPAIFYPPKIESLVCDQRVPFIKTAQTFADIGRHDTVIRYYSCMALARKDASSCDAVKFVDLHAMHRTWDAGHRTRENLAFTVHGACKADSRRLLLGRALIANDPSAGKLCGEICREGGIGLVLGTDRPYSMLPVRGDPHSCEKLCSLAVKHRSEPERFCAEALAQPFLKDSALAAESCRNKLFAIMVGLGGPISADETLKRMHDPDSAKRICAEGQPCFDVEDVSNYAAFRKAFQGKNAELCGDSRICRAMMGGGPEACRPFAEGLRTEVCLEIQQAKRRDEWNRQADLVFNEKRSQLQHAIERFNAECGKKLDQIRALDDRLSASIDKMSPDAPGLDSRKEELASASRRHRELAEKFRPIEALH